LNKKGFSEILSLKPLIPKRISGLYFLVQAECGSRFEDDLGRLPRRSKKQITDLQTDSS
jgi:hypothetical protein